MYTNKQFAYQTLKWKWFLRVYEEAESKCHSHQWKQKHTKHHNILNFFFKITTITQTSIVNENENDPCWSGSEHTHLAHLHGTTCVQENIRRVKG